MLVETDPVITLLYYYIACTIAYLLIFPPSSQLTCNNSQTRLNFGRVNLYMPSCLELAMPLRTTTVKCGLILRVRVEDPLLGAIFL